jgi:hypothetical protein
MLYGARQHRVVIFCRKMFKTRLVHRYRGHGYPVSLVSWGQYRNHMQLSDGGLSSRVDYMRGVANISNYLEKRLTSVEILLDKV